MSSVPFLLAATAAEAVNPAFAQAATFCFALSGLCALITAGVKLFAERRHALGSVVAALGLVLALVQFTFAWQVRHVDFQPSIGAVSATGSPSPLKSLMVPFIPVLLNGLLLLAHRKASRSPATEEN